MAQRKDAAILPCNQENDLIESILEILDKEMAASEKKLEQKHAADNVSALVADFLDSFAVDFPKE